jgi:hypothetical protein
MYTTMCCTGEACYEALEELICTQAPLLSVLKLMCLQVCSYSLYRYASDTLAIYFKVHTEHAAAALCHSLCYSLIVAAFRL